MKKFILIAFAIVAPIQGHKIFLEQPPKEAPAAAIDGAALKLVAQEMVNFLQKVHLSKYFTFTIGTAFENSITLEDLIKTYEFIAKQPAKTLERPWFFIHNFKWYRWYADEDAHYAKSPYPGEGTAPDYIRTTAYRMLTIKGSHTKTVHHCIPVYEQPLDEKNIPTSTVHAQQGTYLRYRYSFDQICSGILENNPQTKVLTWLSPSDYKEFTKQGSSIVECTNGTRVIISVTGHNNKKDDKQIYWFAVQRPVEKKCTTNSTLPIKIEPHAHVTCAGNTELLGFGKLIALIGKPVYRNHPTLFIEVLTDRGSAFNKNGSQLDLYLGAFSSEESFKEALRKIPHSAKAYILIKK